MRKTLHDFAIQNNIAIQHNKIDRLHKKYKRSIQRKNRQFSGKKNIEKISDIEIA